MRSQFNDAKRQFKFLGIDKIPLQNASSQSRDDCETLEEWSFKLDGIIKFEISFANGDVIVYGRPIKCQHRW